MENSDPVELAESANSPFKTYCALMVSVLAMVLAINNLGGSNTGKEATMNNILAANMYSFYQAKNVRQTQYKLAADEIERQLALQKWTPSQEALLKDKLAIVLTSVAIITGRRAMSYMALVLGIVGTLSTFNGYFLFF
ncbi:MAG: DUF4337 family protein [Betaproteobacteria bacterium]|nr:DUF4337 family protein [Betaproteobacteria bacterium]